MLPAFQVRNMRRSSSSPPRASHGSPNLASICDPLVKITAPEYDRAISDHPEATLKYMDDDDGEIVTVSVGSRMLAGRTNIDI